MFFIVSQYRTSRGFSTQKDGPRRLGGLEFGSNAEGRESAEGVSGRAARSGPARRCNAAKILQGSITYRGHADRLAVPRGAFRELRTRASCRAMPTICYNVANILVALQRDSPPYPEKAAGARGDAAVK